MDKFRYETTAAAALEKAEASLRAAARDLEEAGKHLGTPALLVALSDVSRATTPADMRINSLTEALITEGLAGATAKVAALRKLVRSIEIKEGGKDE